VRLSFFLIFVIDKTPSLVYNHKYCARRGASGALYLQSTTAGLNYRPRSFVWKVRRR